MRTLWTAISVVAVANLLALVAFVGWLRMSDRLNSARVTEVRELLKETTPQRQAREERARLEQEAAQRAQEARAHAQLPPITAANTLELRLQQSQADQARLDAIRREVQIMQDTLRRERLALDADRAAFEKERSDFQAARRQIAETEGDVQFKKTLSTYEALKPDKAKAALSELIKDEQKPQVVAYLNAMQERTRTRIIDEFIKDDPRLATELLELLRTRGLSVAGK
jgi:hypothetical protein